MLGRCGNVDVLENANLRLKNGSDNNYEEIIELNMNERLHTLISEIREKCHKTHCFEFDYHWEDYGLNWHPWFLTISGRSESFSFNDISYEDLKELCDERLIELIKEYSEDEISEGEFDKKRYRLM